MSKHVKKLQVNFSPSVWEKIEKLKHVTGGTAADVIRDALGLYEWAVRQHREGNELGVIRNNKLEAKVILPIEFCGTRVKGDET